MWDQTENYDLDTSESQKKDNSLLKLTLNFHINFEHADEAVHLLYKPLPLSV